MYKVREVKTMHLFAIHAQFQVAPFYYRRYLYEKANITLFVLHVSDIKQQKYDFKIKFCFYPYLSSTCAEWRHWDMKLIVSDAVCYF